MRGSEFGSLSSSIVDDDPYPRTASQHAALLHPPKRRGRVVLGRKVPVAEGSPRKWDQESYRPYELEMALLGREGEADLYASQNRFRGKGRAVKDLEALGAIYTDLDYYNVPELAGLPAETVLQKALERLQEAGMLVPSLALDSGKGMYLVWLHRPVERRQLPSWNAAQHALFKLMRPLGADALAKDASRVLRLAGTVNSKKEANGARVRSLRDAAQARPLDFEELAQALFAVRERERDDNKEEPADLYSRAVAGVPRGNWKGPRGWSDASLWEGRLTDLQKLRELRYGEGRHPMADFRNRWLFIAGVAISWLCIPEVLDRELIALAEEAGGWEQDEARRSLAAVFERTHMAARGETVIYDGFEWDARYHFKNETIRDWLEISADEEREMVVTISDTERRRRDREYRREKRRREGAQSAANYKDKRAVGAKRNADSARHLKSCGLSNARIAADMNVSERTVRRWLP